MEKDLKYKIKALLTPWCWLQNHQYSEAWDRKLRSLMETHKFIQRGDAYAEIGGCLIWAANHPYASFKLLHANVRPSRATILMAMDRMVEDFVEANGKMKNSS